MNFILFEAQITTFKLQLFPFDVIVIRLSAHFWISFDVFVYVRGIIIRLCKRVNVVRTDRKFLYQMIEFALKFE